MENEQVNYDYLHTFFEGMTTDLDNHAETNKNFYEALNLRLISKDGILSLSSIQGTKKVYQNKDIKKYMGYWSFSDELIVFAKVNKKIDPNIIDYIEQEIILAESFSVSSNSDIQGIDFLSKITKEIVEVPVVSDPIDEEDFTQYSSCSDSEIQPDMTYNDLFKIIPFLPIHNCNIDSSFVPENNVLFKDAIYSFKFNQNKELEASLIYVGNLDIPINSKISTFGVSENSFYKRVYFTNYYNVSRVINIKDKNLMSRTAEELSLFATGTLLSPRIIKKENKGQLPAMAVMYMMRLITENGQLTDFSAASPVVYINKNDSDIEFSGADTKQITNKSVVVGCHIPNYKNFKNVELIAVQYEAFGIPSSIILIGRKETSSYVEFVHYGVEKQFAENITLSDILKNSLSWKYNSDYVSKNNKLYVCGLRNDPSYIFSKNIDIDFSLHGFDKNGNTHSCLRNSDPSLFNYIDNEMTESFFYIKQKIYRKIEVFGNFSFKLINKSTGEFISFSYQSSVEKYVDFTQNILNDLLEYQLNAEFILKFPNLVISNSKKRILFKPLDDLVITDFSVYEFSFSTLQVILDMDNDIELNSFDFPDNDNERKSRLVYGGVSNGWFKGNGVKVTMSSEYSDLLNKNTNWHKAGEAPLKIIKPTLKKYVMKGEIYRIGIQWYKNGNRNFVTILGDIKIPEVGQRIREIDSSGAVYAPSLKYSNQRIENDVLQSHGILLQFDVRINCDFSKEVDAYEIVYVERTEDNRTILAQGISAPLERLVPFVSSGFVLKEPIANKWMLPSYGGPVYDLSGLAAYDTNPNSGNEGVHKVLTNRKMFYFDSPDFIYEKISPRYVGVSKMDPLFSIGTDHDKFNIITGYDRETNGDGIGVATVTAGGSFIDNGSYVEPFGLPKFSNKLSNKNMKRVPEYMNPFLVNVSVFSQIYSNTFKQFPSFGQSSSELVDIDISKEFLDGEIASSFKFKDNFDVSNKTIANRIHSWYYSTAARSEILNTGQLFLNHNVSNGRSTVIIKTKNNFFTASRIGQPPFPIIMKPILAGGTASASTILAHDAHIISNIKRDNYNSVYGGRSELAYASNTYISMSEIIPIEKNFVSSQVFKVNGDTYVTLFLRNKTSYKGELPTVIETMQVFLGSARDLANPPGAWCYAVVLETTVEPRLNHSDEFYRMTGGFEFKMEESLNPVYLQENTIRTSIPKPLNFKDDPNLNNIVAASEIKLSGDYYDAFSVFKTNEFHELDKDKGSALNFAKQEDQIYVIQEQQTSTLQIDEDRMLSTDGKPVYLAQGQGKSISGHTVVSDYGTSIRRSVVESKTGFIFFDERKKEMVKIIEPLLLTNKLSLTFHDLFTNNEITDIEGYYDDKYKETNIRFRTKTNLNFVLSYNEALKCFNGKIEYDNDLYMTFQEEIIAPYQDGFKLGQLNVGEELIFFESRKDILVGVISAPDYPRTKIEKGIAININTNYPIDNVVFETSLGHIRTVLGNHHRYFIKEGIHTVPAVNMMDKTHIRGEWIKVLLKTRSYNNKKVSIFGIVNYLRNSYK